VKFFFLISAAFALFVTCPVAQVRDGMQPESLSFVEISSAEYLPVRADEAQGKAGAGIKIVTDIADDNAGPPVERPDRSHLTIEAEREARLGDLFAKLGTESDADAAKLVAEEIWAIWLDSGSASVNMILRRGTAAEEKGDVDLARRMYDHVTTLSPDYAEGWARSGRLAYSENDLSRCITEVTQALVIEPRHFYAIWTLGNALEKLGRREEALEAYREARRLYPELKALKDRIAYLENEINGEVL